MLTVIARVA